MSIEVIFGLVVLIFSAVIHEVSHGAMAYSLGDPTAKMRGRLTLNPISHIDLYGTIILPLLMAVLSGGSFIFGYAKPVPYNPYNLNNQRWGPALVAAAGPLSNFALAIGLAIVYRATSPFIPGVEAMRVLFYYAILVNVILGAFNAVPIPPLDGSKVLLSLFPRNRKLMETFQALERNGIILVLAFAFFIFPILVDWLAYIAFLLIGG